MSGMVTSASDPLIIFYREKKPKPFRISVFLIVGVAGFELATSTSLRWRSNQAEPHPVNK